MSELNQPMYKAAPITEYPFPENVLLLITNREKELLKKNFNETGLISVETHRIAELKRWSRDVQIVKLRPVLLVSFYYYCHWFI